MDELPTLGVDKNVMRTKEVHAQDSLSDIGDDERPRESGAGCQRQVERPSAVGRDRIAISCQEIIGQFVLGVVRRYRHNADRGTGFGEEMRS